MWVTRIEIDLHRFEQGALKAFADASFAFGDTDLTVRGFRVIQRDGEQPWVGLPSSSFTNKDGKTVNKTVIEMSRRLHKVIIEQILAKYSSSTKCGYQASKPSTKGLTAGRGHTAERAVSGGAGDAPTLPEPQTKDPSSA